MMEGDLVWWPVWAAALYLGTFIHEDVAILAGSFAVVEWGIPPAFALLPLFFGIVTGDVLLYGLGGVARRSSFLRRLLIHGRIPRLRDWLDRNLIVTMTVCRLVPGTVFPVFVACGWFGLSFRRFFMTTFISSFIYAAIMLSLATMLGEAIVIGIGDMGWAMFAVGLVAATLFGVFRPVWRALPRLAGFDLPDEAAPSRRRQATHRGMPATVPLDRAGSLAEALPAPLFYAPLAAQWLWLGLRHGGMTLPTVANPLLQAGGLMGESKSDCLEQVGPAGRRWIAPFATVPREREDADGARTLAAAEAAMERAALDYPIVAKPDIGWRGFGVRLVPDRDALRRYFAAYPAGETAILQQPVDYDGEAGVFYVRLPGTDRGSIFSMTFRYYPHVMGDGRSTLRQLIEQDPRASSKSDVHLRKDPMHCGAAALDLDAVPDAGEIVRLSFIGSNRVGGLYRDARRYITPALTERIDRIAKSIPEFWFGRFDLRFRSIDSFIRGEAFSIVEVNGAGAEAIHIWDPDVTLGEAYRALFEQQSLMFEIASRNRARGFRPLKPSELHAYQQRQNRLVRLYPPSS
jgi:membrane protein DedA with SNARE-associated domain